MPRIGPCHQGINFTASTESDAMKNRREWHKLKEAHPETGAREEDTRRSKKPPAHTNSTGGSRQGNAGMEKDTNGARR